LVAGPTPSSGEAYTGCNLLRRHRIEPAIEQENNHRRRVKMKLVTRCALTLAYAWSAVALGSTSTVPTETSIGNVSKVNGSVRVEAGQQAGSISTVNGSVTIGAAARTEEVETVNGSVRIEDRAVVDEVETVNGGITAASGVEVRGDLETVNGSITLREGVRVGGGLENVNGDMLLEGAEVQQGIETTNGDIRLAAGTRLLGGIHVEESRSQSWFGKRSDRNPRISIEQGAVVQGPLHFEREVDLYVAPGVTLPEVQGVPPKRYTLD
jgi:hypothetical protein